MPNRKFINVVVTGLSCTALCVPAVAQGSGGSRQEHQSEQRKSVCGGETDVTSGYVWHAPMISDTLAIRRGVSSFALQFALVLPAPVVRPKSPAVAQGSSRPPEEERSEKTRPISYGVEMALSSGYADRGLVISDRPVVQPSTWVSGSIASFSLWSNITLAETTDRSRPQILEMELTRAHQWSDLTIEPAIRMFFYRDPQNIYSSRSIEGWLYLSYDAGPFSLVTNHSYDVLAYKGAYFGEAGLEFDRRVSHKIEIGGSFKTGWASSAFNDAYVGIDKSAFNLVSVESWLTAYVKPHLYIRPYFQFSTIVDGTVRAELARPKLFFVGLATGVEF
jgi:hypothetical protein